MKTQKSDEPILRTLLYSDIFEYPLKEEEIWELLITPSKIEASNFLRDVRRINSVVYRKNGFLHVKGREDTVKQRLRRNQHSREKIEFAQSIIEKLSIFPSVLFIGISGSLSVLNSDKDDDIDLFVITKSGKIWTTRLFLISYLKLLGLHRGKNSQKTSNTFCLNMLIDEKNLSLPKKYRNIYAAHEIAQLIPVVSRENTYEKFIKTNDWILRFMPNAISFRERWIKGKTRKPILLDPAKLPLVENLTKKLQLFLINKTQTNEVVKDGFLAFHPMKIDKKILDQYKKRLVKYNLSSRDV